MRAETMALSSESMNMRRFYLRASAVVAAIALVSYLRLPREFVAGVITGGSLSIINIRGMARGVRQMLSIDKPSPGRLLISGILRLLILSGVIILIAFMTTINLVGLLIGFAVVPLMLAAEGLLYVKGLKGPDEEQGPACNSRSGH